MASYKIFFKIKCKGKRSFIEYDFLKVPEDHRKAIIYFIVCRFNPTFPVSKNPNRFSKL